MPVFLFADLDVIIRDFDKITPSAEANKLREELIDMVDKIIDDANKLKPIKSHLIKEENNEPAFSCKPGLPGLS